MIRGRRDRRRQAAVLGVVAMLAAAVSLPPSAVASADSQPPILADYNLDWIERVDESAWPLPREQRPVICLLDTGVAVTPDTPADNPAGPIVARLDVDGRGGEPQGDSRLHVHGTQMASIIAAPRNDWGTVGILPQARIVSVRVTIGADVFATPASVAAGVDACLRWSRVEGAEVGVIVMAESHYEQRPIDVAGWRRAGQVARQGGALLVAAVGNDIEATLVAPIAADGVVAIAAADPSGALCHFSPVVPPSTFVGPGCDPTRRRWIAGSSSATAAAGALAGAIAMRGLPGESGDSYSTPTRIVRAEYVEKQFARSAVASGSGRRIDGSGVLRDHFAGLVRGQESDAVGVATPEAPPQPFADGAAQAQTREPRLRVERPRVSATWRRGKLTIRRVTHKRSGRLVVEVGTGKRMRMIRTMAAQVRVTLKKPPRQVRAWVESKSPGTWVTLTRRTYVVRR